MWKLFLFSIITISSSYAADLYCTSFSSSNQCVSIDNITNVAAENEIINVIGQPSTYIDLQTTTITIDSRSKFDCFPTEFFKIFPYLQTLTSNENNIVTLVTDSFNFCNNLKSLTVAAYKFNNLPAAFAQNCVNLEQLTISGGELTTLDPDALKGLSSLRFFLATFNKIKCLPPTFFIFTPNIEQISLSYNQITALDPTTFRNLPKVFDIEFTHNDIAYLPNFDFTNTSIVSASNKLYLYFDLNSLKAIDLTFINTIFSARQSLITYLYISPDSSSVSFPTTCLPNSSFYIDKTNYTLASSIFGNCYNNWLPSMAKNYNSLCSIDFHIYH